MPPTTKSSSSKEKPSNIPGGAFVEALGKAAQSTGERLKEAGAAVGRAVKNVGINSRDNSPVREDDDVSSSEFGDQLGPMMMDESEQNVQGLLSNLTRATRYSVLELRGLMASLNESTCDSQDLQELQDAYRKRIQKDKDENDNSKPLHESTSSRSSEEEDMKVMENLQKASRSSVLELRGMLASINTISNSTRFAAAASDISTGTNVDDEDEEDEDPKRKEEEQQIQELLSHLEQASRNSEMEVRGMLASMTEKGKDGFAEIDYRYADTSVERERWTQIHRTSLQSVNELRELLGQVEEVTRKKSSGRTRRKKNCVNSSLSESIRTQLKLDVLDDDEAKKP